MLNTAPDFHRVLDRVKGLAILGVVLFHLWPVWFGWQGVHLFLLVSGFALYFSAERQGGFREKGSVRHWLRRRLRRILPGYWLAAAAGYLLVLGLHQAHLPVSLSLAEATRNLALQVMLLQGIWSKTLLADPNAALWFVPLIAGLYLVFPLLYPGMSLSASRRVALGTLAIAVGIELTYRAIALFAWNGMPIAYGHGALTALGLVPEPRHLLNGGSGAELWFHGVAPFGWFPARVGEFALGIFAAREAEWLRAQYTVPGRKTMLLIAGALVWALGNSLIYAGPASWIFSDLVLAAGLGLTVPALAVRMRAGSLSDRILVLLGRCSYPIFLFHLPVGFLCAALWPLWGIAPLALALSTALLALALALRKETPRATAS